eukprot:SAG31_NODE_3265_length_4480_cov_19.931066_1_plen_183_part_00
MCSDPAANTGHCRGPSLLCCVRMATWVCPSNRSAVITTLTMEWRPASQPTAHLLSSVPCVRCRSTLSPACRAVQQMVNLRYSQQRACTVSGTMADPPDRHRAGWQWLYDTHPADPMYPCMYPMGHGHPWTQLYMYLSCTGTKFSTVSTHLEAWSVVLVRSSIITYTQNSILSRSGIWSLLLN